jgi:hypothetical protein
MSDVSWLSRTCRMKEPGVYHERENLELRQAVAVLHSEHVQQLIKLNSGTSSKCPKLSILQLAAFR